MSAGVSPYDLDFVQPSVATAAETSALEQLKKNLRRPHLPALDGVRAVAVLLVVLSHVGFHLPVGSLGVLIFFVLSGFLITWILLKEESKQGSVSIKMFWMRRSLRIFPAFYVYWLLVVVGLGSLHLGRGLTVQALCSFFYVNNYFQGIWGDPNTGLSHTWSLAIEEQFYVFWPVLFLLLRNNRSRLKTLLALIGCLWVYREVMVLGFHVGQGYVYEALDMRADHLLIGCLLAVALYEGYFERLWKWLCRSAWLQLAPVAILVMDQMITASGVPRYRDWGGFILEPVMVFLLLPQLMAFNRGPVTRLLELPAMRYIGRISYSMYLYQQLVIHAVVHRFAGRSFFVTAGAVVVGLIGVIACASASHYLAERPFLKLKDRLAGERTPVVRPGLHASMEQAA